MSKGWAGICRFGGVGDNLVAASVLRPLKKLGYNVEMVTTGKGSNTHTVFLNNPFIDKLSLKNDGDIPSGGNEWQEWFAKRSGEYDIFVNLSHSMEYLHSFFKSQTQFWWPQDFRRKIAGGSYLETVHDIVGVPHTFGPLFFPTDEELENAGQMRDEQVKGRFLSWVISGSRIDKIYPYAAMVIGRIIIELGIPVVLFGVGDKQAEMANQIRDHVIRQNGTRDMFHMVVQDHHPAEKQWPLRTALTGCLAGDCIVTPDTGMAWAAAFEKMPKIVMVSHASAENITKHWVNTTTLHADPMRVPCWPCHRLHDTIDTCVPNKDGGHAAACISDISAQTILDAVKKAWHRPVETKVTHLREVA